MFALPLAEYWIASPVLKLCGVAKRIRSREASTPLAVVNGTPASIEPARNRLPRTSEFTGSPTSEFPLESLTITLYSRPPACNGPLAVWMAVPLGM